MRALHLCYSMGTAIARTGLPASGPLDAIMGPVISSPIGKTFRDVAEILEDPKPPADAMFSKQRPMYEVREYDADGFRVPMSR